MATIFLLGNLRASLTLARSLSRAGHRIIAGMDGADPYLFLSRHVSETIAHAPLDQQPQAAMDRVIDALQAHKVDILLPVSEVATRLVARNAERLSAFAHLATPGADLVARCADKAGLFDACEVAGVPQAERRIVSSIDELHTAAETIGGPVIVKPTDSTAYVLGQKAVYCASAKVAASAFSAWPVEHQTLCVQRFVDGPRLNVYFAASQGRLVGAVPVEILRTDALDGTGYAVSGRSITADDKLRRATEALIAHLDYHGVGCAQFMLSSDGRSLSFLEINPRLGANFKIAEACGLNLSELSVSLPRGDVIAPASDPWCYPSGRRYAWTKGAISGALRAKRTGEVGWSGAISLMVQTLREALAPCHLTLELTDPMPTVGLYANIFAGKLMERRVAAVLADPQKL